jgi:hypothetical protein
MPRFEKLPVYLPDDIASHLPLLPSFTAVLLGELRPREDLAETEKEVFLPLAVARRLDGKGSGQD